MALLASVMFLFLKQSVVFQYKSLIGCFYRALLMPAYDPQIALLGVVSAFLGLVPSALTEASS